MNHDARRNRHEASAMTEASVMTDEPCELERCKQEIARLRQLVVQLSEIVLRNIVESNPRHQSERP